MQFLTVLNLIRKGNYQEAKKQLKEFLDNGTITKDDLLMVKRYFEASKTPYAGYVLFRLLCKDREYFEAYEVYLKMMRQFLKKKDISFLDITGKADLNSLKKIALDLTLKLDEDLDVAQSLLMTEVVDHLIFTMLQSETDLADTDKVIAGLAEKIWFGDLIRSTYLYEIAISCKKADHPLAEKLLVKVIEKEPANCNALKELGDLFEQKGQEELAKKYLDKAAGFCNA